MDLREYCLNNRRLESLVENQSSFTLDHAAMHIFETHQQAEQVLLQYDQPVLASMIEGKQPAGTCCTLHPDTFARITGHPYPE